MVSASTVYTFDINLSNVDRGIYESFTLQAARHPSETISYLVTRVLAYCLEYCEGISFSKGLAEADEPAIWAHDLTGALALWVEIGAPSAERLHRASKLGVPVAVYTHKDPDWLLAELRKGTIYAAEDIRIYSLPIGFVDALSVLIERRTKVSISLSEGELYVQLGGQDLSTQLATHSILP